MNYEKTRKVILRYIYSELSERLIWRVKFLVMSDNKHSSLTPSRLKLERRVNNKLWPVLWIGKLEGREFVDFYFFLWTKDPNNFTDLLYYILSKRCYCSWVFNYHYFCFHPEVIISQCFISLRFLIVSYWK